jgi:hypothetical protein
MPHRKTGVPWLNKRCIIAVKRIRNNTGLAVRRTIEKGSLDKATTVPSVSVHNAKTGPWSARKTPTRKKRVASIFALGSVLCTIEPVGTY